MGCGAKYDGEQQTPYTVYLKKTSDQREELDPKKEKFFRRRKRWEPVIVEMLREEFEAEIVAVNQRYVDPEIPFLAAELDFEWRDADGKVQNGEIKTVHPLAFGEKQGWGEAGTDEIPVQYAAQVMHGLGVARRDVCIVAAMIGLDDMIFYRLTRDGYEQTIADMRAKCVRFWNEHVLAGVPPDPQTWEDMMRLFARVNGRPVECTQEIVDALDKLRALRGSIKAMEDEKETVTFEIADFVRRGWGIQDPETPAQTIDNAELRWNGLPIATWKKQRGAHLDQKGLREAHPEIVAEFTREHWFRPIRFKKS
jgi:predicted phage-related endonuclease